MTVGCLIVCCSLLSQQATPRSTVPPTPQDPEPAGQLVPVEQRKPKLTPPVLVREALTPLAQDPLTGRPLPLLEVLTRSATRPRQLAAVQAYWTLAAAVGEYHYCRQEHDALSALAAGAAHSRNQADRLESTALAAEVALAAARVKEAELRLAATQAELAEKTGLPLGDRTPLPANEPHVGEYRTLFNAIFASRVAPPRLQLLERILPLRRKAIDVRSEAVQAATDALVAAQDALGRHELEAEAVGARLEHLARQRKAFLESVKQYNHEIAEYALAVADPNFPPANVLPMLIKQKDATAPTANDRSTSAAAEAEESPRAGQNPTGMRSLLKSSGDQGERRLKPSLADLELAQLAPGDTEQTDYENYAALLGLSPPKRTHRLARLLHWDRSLPDSAEPALTLQQCLSAVPPADRRRALEIFWLTREQSARCQVASDQIDQLSALYPTVLQAARRPGGAEAMLDLRACQQAAQADLLECQAQLWVRRLELATLLGKAAQPKDWPLPATTPHGGRYETKLDSQPQTLAQSPVLQNLATTVPGLYSALEDRAEAIVRLDGRRATTIEALDKARHMDLWETLELIDRQATESLTFLTTLTRYNLLIADYALAILPATVSPPELTSSLVVQSK